MFQDISSKKKNFKFFRLIKISSPNHLVFPYTSTFFHGNRLIFGWWLKADKKPSESWRLKSRLSVSANNNRKLKKYYYIKILYIKGLVCSSQISIRTNQDKPNLDYAQQAFFAVVFWYLWRYSWRVSSIGAV